MKYPKGMKYLLHLDKKDFENLMLPNIWFEMIEYLKEKRRLPKSIKPEEIYTIAVEARRAVLIKDK